VIVQYLNKWLAPPRRGSRGLTLVELLIALAIGSLVAVGALGVLNQLFVLIPKAQNGMLAIRQAQSAGYWIDRDGVSGQIITPTPSLFTLSAATPLVISSVNWNSDNTIVTYSVDTNLKLQRQEVVKNKSGVTISSTLSQVADSISSITAQYDYPNPGDARKILTITITAQVGSATETRVYKISPRSF
jgi:prepilin-type N-terminal cleavage/methylation domain-containing protein